MTGQKHQKLDISDVGLTELARQTGEQLLHAGLMLATAESCTGGWVAKLVTDIEGSSHWFERGFVTYTNDAKQELLGVGADTLAQFGAVSEPTVQAMAAGALAHSHADISLAITGIAGPGGGSSDKPVGLVWFAWAGLDQPVLSQSYIFDGDREQIRRQAVATALLGVQNRIRAHAG